MSAQWCRRIARLCDRLFRKRDTCLSESVNAGLSYISAAPTIRAARLEGFSICDYLEKQWGQEGCTDQVIAAMQATGCLTSLGRVCEIGPGTGRYLERVLARARPSRYEIYETASDWRQYLATEYPLVVAHAADGRTMRQTPDKSCQLIHAHGVFVYLPFLSSFEYFREMARVCASGGWIVLDFYPAESFDTGMIHKWLATSDRYPVPLREDVVRQFFVGMGFACRGEFSNRYGHGHSKYLIFRDEQP